MNDYILPQTDSTKNPLPLEIDKEFQSLIPPLSSEERELLETSIKAEGCRDAIVIWKGHNTIIDGHNRYAICSASNLPFKTVEREFETREDVVVWIIRNQFGRRNLTPFVRSELALKLKDAIAAKAKANQSHGQTAPGVSLRQNFAEAIEPIDTKTELAKAADVSREQIRKVEVVTTKAPESIKDAARRGDISTHQAYEVTRALEDAPEPVKKEVARVFSSGESVTAREITAMVKHPETIGAPKALQMSVSNEWYTPKEYLEAARELMGAIDTDPASNPIANQIVQARVIYTIETNGLDKPWHGRVWLNPPYGREDGDSNQDVWSARLVEQFKKGITSEAILLVNAVTDRKWFQPLWEYPICFTDHRIKFYKPDGIAGQPTHGNCFVYMGKNIDKFSQLFSKFGVVVTRYQPTAVTLAEVA